MPTALTAFALNCTLKSSKAGEPSSTDKLVADLFDALRPHGVSCESVRAADFNILPGVSSDEGDGDDWPGLRSRILTADIFVLGTPIWLGQPSSVAKRVMERMDAFLDETDDRQRMPAFGKVAVAAIVGNEDGAHHCHAEIFQALNDVGFTVPATAGGYWVGEAMQSKNYVDLPRCRRRCRRRSTCLLQTPPIWPDCCGPSPIPASRTERGSRGPERRGDPGNRSAGQNPWRSLRSDARQPACAAAGASRRACAGRRREPDARSVRQRPEAQILGETPCKALFSSRCQSVGSTALRPGPPGSSIRPGRSVPCSRMGGLTVVSSRITLSSGATGEPSLRRSRYFSPSATRIQASRSIFIAASFCGILYGTTDAGRPFPARTEPWLSRRVGRMTFERGAHPDTEEPARHGRDPA